MEISVVLPQPDGPTRSVICPSYTSRSTPRRASVRVPLAPNSFVTPLQDTAAVPLGPNSSPSRGEEGSLSPLTPWGRGVGAERAVPAAGGGLSSAAVAIICVYPFPLNHPR